MWIIQRWKDTSRETSCRQGGNKSVYIKRQTDGDGTVCDIRMSSYNDEAGYENKLVFVSHGGVKEKLPTLEFIMNQQDGFSLDWFY